MKNHRTRKRFFHLRILFYAAVVIVGELIVLLGFFSAVGVSEFESNQYCGTPNASSSCPINPGEWTFTYAIFAVGIAVMMLGFIFFFRSGRATTDERHPPKLDNLEEGVNPPQS